MSAERYTVRVTKDHFIFCCAHFITYEGDQCEKLHGHNYRTAVELDGGLDENWYLFDFIALKRCVKAITDELDHHMLLATLNPWMRIEEQAGRVRVAYREKEWIFPREDCILLPIENTTAELLGRYIGKRLLDDLKRKHNLTPEVMRVEIEESFGQAATYEWRHRPTRAVMG